MSPLPAARLTNVRLELGERAVLDDITFDVPATALTAIVGPNGCGKSTLARLLTGFLFPTRGSVEILGHRLGEVNVHELRQRVKLVQPTMVHEPDPRFRVRDVIATGAFGTIDLYDTPSDADWSRVDALIDQLGLRHVAESSLRTCSTGERMRTQIARALMTGPRLLILDEPTAGLDIPMREQLLATLDMILTTPDAPAILLVTHHLEELPPSTKQVILMSRGHVSAIGSPESVLTSEAMTRAFDFPLEVTRVGDRYFAHLASSR